MASKSKLFRMFKAIGITSPSGIADKAVKRVLGDTGGDPAYITENFSELVEQLQITAYDIYLEEQEKTGQRVIQEYLQTNIPESADRDEIITEAAAAFDELDKFFLSLTQSRRQRAGVAFEDIIETLFKRLNYPFDEQPVLNGQPDFVLPSEAHFRTNAMDCIIFTSKRTLRERWRQIVTEGMRGLGFFLASIDEKVSSQQLEAMLEHRIYLVLPDSIIEKYEKYQDAVNAISFETFFRDHLDPAMTRWKANKVI